MDGWARVSLSLLTGVRAKHCDMIHYVRASVSPSNKDYDDDDERIEGANLSCRDETKCLSSLSAVSNSLKQTQLQRS